MAGKMFLDSAIADEVKRALDEKLVTGVTTNPSLIAKTPKGDSSLPFIDRYLSHMKCLADICSKYRMQDGDFPSLSVEVFSLYPEEMISQGRQISRAIDYRNLAIKVPISFRRVNYLPVIEALSNEGIAVNCTCCFNAEQMNAAAAKGARFVSLFYRRLKDHMEKTYGLSSDGAEAEALGVLREVSDFINTNSLQSKIIAGSIREPSDILNCWTNGADFPTASYKLVSTDLVPYIGKPVLGTSSNKESGLFHPQTDASVEGFDKDLKAWFSS